MSTTIDSVNPYSLAGGTLASAIESSRSNPAMLRKLSGAEIAAMQEADELLARQQQTRPQTERIYGQVIVHGQVFATVFESGMAITEREITGLSNDGSGLSLANARLQEIAKAVGGEVRRNNFLAAEEVLRLMNWDSVRSQRDRKSVG